MSIRIGETNKKFATGFVNPKTTLLFFDNIWLPSDMMEGLSNREKTIVNRFCLATDFGKEAYIGAVESNAGRRRVSCDNEEEIIYYSSFHRNMTIRQYAESIKRRFNIDVVPIYLNPTQFDLDNYQEDCSKTNVIQLCVNNFPMIDESHLEWEQVNDFRIDHYNEMRRFYLWSLDEFKEKSESEIIENINKELDDFKFAIKKHGILTSVGGFTAILSASATLISSIESGLLSQIGAGLTISCGLITYAAQQVTEYIETKRNPIAYIYDIERYML